MSHPERSVLGPQRSIPPRHAIWLSRNAAPLVLVGVLLVWLVLGPVASTVVVAVVASRALRRIQLTRDCLRAAQVLQAANSHALCAAVTRDPATLTCELLGCESCTLKHMATTQHPRLRRSERLVVLRDGTLLADEIGCVGYAGWFQLLTAEDTSSKPMLSIDNEVVGNGLLGPKVDQLLGFNVWGFMLDPVMFVCAVPGGAAVFGSSSKGLKLWLCDGRNAKLVWTGIGPVARKLASRGDSVFFACKTVLFEVSVAKTKVSMNKTGPDSAPTRQRSLPVPENILDFAFLSDDVVALVTSVELFRMHLGTGVCHLVTSLVSSPWSACASLARRPCATYRSVASDGLSVFLLRSDAQFETWS